MIKRVWKATLFSCLLVALSFSSSTLAQNYWMQDDRGSNVKLEIFKADFAELEGTSFLTTVWSFSGRINVTDRLAVMLELPFVNADIEDRDGESLIGNPYIGIEHEFGIGDGSSGLVSRFGVRLPTAPDDKRLAASVGVASLYNRLEGFYPDMATLMGGIGYKHTFSGGSRIGINIDLVNLITTDDDDDELLFDYNAEWWQPVGKVNLALGIAGRMMLTQEGMDLGERTEQQLGLAANVDLGKFRPGVHFRIPMEEWLTNVVDFIYGVNLTVEFE